MSRVKVIQPNPYLEIKLDLIDLIRGETLQKVAIYFKKCQIFYEYLPIFLKNPSGYPGDPSKLKLIVDKFLRDIISKYYRQIQAENLPIKLVYNIIFKQIFRGKR